MVLWIVMTFPTNCIATIVQSIIFIVEWEKNVFPHTRFVMDMKIVKAEPMKKDVVSIFFKFFLTNNYLFLLWKWKKYKFLKWDFIEITF